MAIARAYSYISSLNAVSHETFLKYIVSQVYQRSWLFRRLKDSDNIIFSSGHSIHYPVRIAELGLSEFVDPDTARFEQVVDTRHPLTEDYAYLITPISLTWEEISSNAGKGDKMGGEIVDLAADKVDEAIQDTEKNFSTKLFQAFASKAGVDPVGLHEIIRTAGTLHNLSQSSCDEWKAGQRDTTTATLALYGTGSLDAMVRACWFDETPAKADVVHVTTKALASIYTSKLLPGERRQPEGDRAGAPYWTDSYFEGLPIVVDNRVSDNEWFLISTKYLRLVTHSDYNFNLDEWEPDPDRYNALRNFISWKGNLLCTRRKAFGCFTALTS